MGQMALVARIREYASVQPRALRFPPVADVVLRQQEKDLGFPIPTLLRLCYLHVGNGGFGPGLGVIGLEGGYESDHGTLVEFYHLVKEENPKWWKDGILPFCEWGCNMYSSVDCSDSRQPVHALREGRFDHESMYTLERFFQLWVEGKPLFSPKPEDFEEVEIINPATRQKAIARALKRKPTEEEP